MPFPRLIPCLDVADGRVVKGIRFQGLRDVGDPVELGASYSESGADELVFLDVTATLERRSTLVGLVRRVAARLQIPFTVGGGVRSAADAEALLEAGADKVAVNSAALAAARAADRAGGEARLAGGRRGDRRRRRRRSLARRNAWHAAHSCRLGRGGGASAERARSCSRRSTPMAPARLRPRADALPSRKRSRCR